MKGLFVATTIVKELDRKPGQPLLNKKKKERAPLISTLANMTKITFSLHLRKKKKRDDIHRVTLCIPSSKRAAFFTRARRVEKLPGAGLGES